MPTERLSPAGRGALREIAAVASELDLAHTSQPALVAAWTELCLRDMKAAMAQVWCSVHQCTGAQAF